MHPKKAVIVQIVTIIQTCHSHNIVASKKRLSEAKRLFSSICSFSAARNSALESRIESIGYTLSKLRYVDPSNEAEVLNVKRDALMIAQQVQRIVELMDVKPDREFDDPEYVAPMYLSAKVA